ncbi:response regulator [Phenylobacterium sp. LH3H17]|uniref:response regulator transcription factor n=1 Tax=Phenylobacterium sp. LH3H17 TaxID=2903901 RepID=UPI0020C9B9D2|nr:response regulator [Phenylobacterium sp. LH3H17]UTP41090.1 response regulator [Phenylobacterium sp. LH3H17]
MLNPLHPKPTILLVDDDVALCAALKFNLEIEGFDVLTCESGEALLLRDLPAGPACMVLDYNLPGITGLDALVQLRQRQVDLPALIITSTPSLNVRARIRAAGASLIEKPLLGDGLVSGIREALAR